MAAFAAQFHTKSKNSTRSDITAYRPYSAVTAVLCKKQESVRIRKPSAKEKQQEGAVCADMRSVPCHTAGAAASSLAIAIRTW